jgi:hypothetical protein
MRKTFFFYQQYFTTKNKVHRITVLPVFFYECEAWSLTLREERILRVFENGVLRKYLDLRETRRQWSAEDCITGNRMISTPHQMSFGRPNWKNEMGGACGTYEGGERCMQGFGGKT